MHLRPILHGMATAFAGREVLAWVLHAGEMEEIVAAGIKACYLVAALAYLIWFCPAQVRNQLGIWLGGAALLRIVWIIAANSDIWNIHWLMLWACPLVAWSCLCVQSYRWYRAAVGAEVGAGR